MQATKGLSRCFNRYYAKRIVKVPTMADSITEGELARFERQVGEFVKADELVATIETDKVDIQVNSPEKGIIVKYFVKEGDSVEVGADLFELDTDGVPTSKQEDIKNTFSAAVSSLFSHKTADEKEQPIVKPVVEPLKIVEKIKESIQKPFEKQSAPVEKLLFSNLTPGTFPVEGEREEKRVKMSRMRLKISERLKESQNTAASLTTFNEIDMSSLVEFRNKFKDSALKENGIKLGFMSAFVKASVYALKAVPAVNASIEDGTEMIVYRDYCDVSVAVSTPKGLVTPVIRNAEKLSFLDVEKAISVFAEKGKENKITMEDMAGGTFTISNGGVFGSLYGTPIINLPQSAILGMHAVKDRPVVVNGEIVIRPMMYVALTYDHRLIDGREAVTFLKTIKECVEDPRKLLL
jgi:2-oxoglutarate dehydrogenase E2 component (dihydrolipoamide succinyltransferase)